jgi:radical SAM protein with 4Fe4S-binding SPASM domain
MADGDDRRARAMNSAFLPLRTRPLPTGEALCVNDTGHFFAASAGFLERLAHDAVSDEDWEALETEGLAVAQDDELGAGAYAYAVAERLARPGPLDYVILVLKILDDLPTEHLKVEFQGGEPTLRPDLIRTVIERCERFPERQFVICTNLQELNPDILALFDREDVYISTSLDGDVGTHERQRTGRGGAKAATSAFFDNLDFVLDRYGARKVSALPTIDPDAPPDIDDLIESYARRGFDSIFLRPINYQGFARKRHAASLEQGEAWRRYHRAFVRNIIARNWQDRRRVLEESYFSICLRRVFQPGHDRYVDLRNPNSMGVDYVVVDHDGQVYPTDEARMLSRAGVIDLAIGDVERGWATPARAALNSLATNQFDPACQRCAYQPFCGRDLVDDLSRYGRVDLPRTETEFCRRHLSIFDFIFELIYEDDPVVQYSLSRWLRLPGTPPALGTRLT